MLDGSTSTPTPIAGIPATDICIVVNSGTPAQGYNVDTGADSIIANSAWNPGCPDFPSYAAYSPPGGFCIPADGPTDASGVTYLTLGGGTWNGTTYTFGRDASRKWGHYDANLEVYVQGVKIFGVWNSFYAPPATPFPSYELRVKSFDWAGGLAAITNQGERVTVLDFNGVANGIGVNNAISYWRDFDFSGSVTSVDLNAITTHLNHTCNFPSTP